MTRQERNMQAAMVETIATTANRLLELELQCGKLLETIEQERRLLAIALTRHTTALQTNKMEDAA